MQFVNASSRQRREREHPRRRYALPALFLTIVGALGCTVDTPDAPMDGGPSADFEVDASRAGAEGEPIRRVNQVALPTMYTTDLDGDSLVVIVDQVIPSSRRDAEALAQYLSLVQWPSGTPVPLSTRVETADKFGDSERLRISLVAQGSTLEHGWYRLSGELVGASNWAAGFYADGKEYGAFDIEGDRASTLVYVGSKILVQSLMFCQADGVRQKFIVQMSEAVEFGAGCLTTSCVDLRNEKGENLNCQPYDPGPTSLGFTCDISGDETSYEFVYFPGFVQASEQSGWDLAAGGRFSFDASALTPDSSACKVYRPPVTDFSPVDFPAGAVTCGQAQTAVQQAFTPGSEFLHDLTACEVDSDCTSVWSQFTCGPPVAFLAAICGSTAIATSSVSTFEARFASLRTGTCQNVRDVGDHKCVENADCFYDTAACVAGACRIVDPNAAH